MDFQDRNNRLASALFRAGLVDEASLRRALAEVGAGDLGAWLVASGRVGEEDVARALGEGLDATVVQPPPRPSARLAASGSTVDALRRSSGLREALSVKPGSALAAGTQVGPYALRKLIARGGMGAVFVAEHAKIGRTVALKVLLAGEEASAEQVARFMTEARTASKLNHPNVIPIYEIGEAGGLHFMTMELVQGASLRKLIKDSGPLEPRRALRYLEQVARGVAAAHALAIIHRDLKPENVLVDAATDVAKVMDFGLAKEVGDEAARGLTVSGALLGTPSYMAPEQADGAKVGPLADVYGLGAILYECLTGKPPFEGPTLANIITQVLGREPVPPRVVRPALNRDVETICLRALEKAPERRYASAGAMAEDAARWLAGEAILARPTPPLERAWRWTRRNLPYVTGGAIAALAVSAALVWVTVVAPAQRRSADARARAAEAAEDARLAARSDADVRSTRERLEKIGGGAEPSEASVREAEKLIRAESAALRERWTRLGEAARALAGERPPFVHDGALVVALWLRLAEREEERAPSSATASGALKEASRASSGATEGRAAIAALWRQRGLRLLAAGAAREDEALRAFARSYRAAPTSAEGRTAIAEVAIHREGLAGDDAIQHLLALATGVPPDVEKRLLLERARRRFARMDLGGAVQDLDRIRGYPPAAELDRFVRPLQAYTDVDWPEKGPPGGRRLLALRAGQPARLQLDYPDGSGAVATVDLAGRKLRPLVTLAPAKLPAGETPVRIAFGGTAERPLGAYFSTGRVLYVCDGRTGEVLGGGRGKVVRNSGISGALEFIDLGGEAGEQGDRAELLLVMGPNEGDSVVVRVAADGRVAPEDFDVPGRSSPTMPSAQCYITAVARGVLGGEPRLVVAYGSWGANDLRLYHERGGRVVPLGQRAAVGPIHELQLVDLRGDGQLAIVAAHEPAEEDWRPGWTPLGLAVYQSNGETVRTPPVAHVKLARMQRRDYSIEGISVARIEGRPYAFFKLRPNEPNTSGLLGRFVVASLEPGEHEPLLDVPFTGAWDLVGVADLEGDGRQSVLAAAPGGQKLRVLGPGGVERYAAPPADPPIGDDRAETMAVGFLASFGYRDEAVQELLDREARSGVTPETEALALELLADAEEEEGSRRVAGEPFRPDAELVARLDAFLGQPGRSLRGAWRARILAARHLTRTDERESRRRAAELVSGFPGIALDPRDRETLERIARIVGLDETGPRVELDLRDRGRDESLARIVADDPLLVRIVEKKGLVATISKRSLFAGVPVTLPAGAVRLTVDLVTEGRTWDGRVEVGLFREDGRSRARFREALGVSIELWRAQASIVETRQELAPAIGLSRFSEADDRNGSRLLDEATGRALPFEVDWRHLHGGRFRAIIEHDPATRWTRYVLRDLASGRTIHERAGVSEIAVAPGAYLAGLHALGSEVDYIGQNMPSFATATLERIVVEQPRGGREPPSLGQDTEPGLAALAGGKALLLDTRLGDKVAAVAAWDRAVAASPPGERSELLVFRAAVKRRVEDTAGARADLARALADDPCGFFRAVERSGFGFDDELSSVVRDVLAEALRALDARLVERPDDVPALEERAFVLRLRGEIEPVVADLARAQALAGADDEARAYLRCSLEASPGNQEALARLRRTRVTPLRPEFLRSFWSPLEPVADLEAFLDERHREHLKTLDVRHAPATWDRWLRRSIELCPRARARVHRARAALLAQLLGKPELAAMRYMAWLLPEDLRAALALEPDDQRTLLTVTLYEVQWVDVFHARPHLRALRAKGVDLEAQLEKDVKRSFVKREGDPEGEELWRSYKAALLAPER